MGETRNEAMQEVRECNIAFSEREAVAEEPYKSGSVQYIESREVAKMVEKDHDKLCRDIRRYTSQLDAANFGDISSFWTESTYADAYGRTQKCYLVTQKGCEFIAHKLTGEKGSVFTATYINRFHEMKDELAGSSSLLDALADTMKEYMLYQEKRNEEQMKANQQQAEFNQMVSEFIKNLAQSRMEYKGNPYCAAGSSVVESRKKELYALTSKVAELCGNSQTKVLHYMYRALEEDLGIVLDSYKSVYRSEKGLQDVEMVEVIAANDQIYEMAAEMNKAVIERKQIYG